MEKKSFKLRLAVYLLVLLLVIVGLSKIPFPKFLEGKTFSFSFLDSSLSGVVRDLLEESEGEYAIYIENLASGEKYGLNEEQAYPAASLYKVFLLAAVLQEIENGKLKMDNKVSASKDYLSGRLGSVDFGYEDVSGDISYTVDEAMVRVGRISDNFAAIMLADKVGWEKIQNMVNKIGAKNTSIKDPISTSSSDMGLFFKKLYNGEVVSKDASAKIIEYLSLSNLNDRIPAGVPEGVRVVHKTGELKGIRNDAGIVYLASQGEALSAYVIVIMAKDVTYEDDAVEKEVEISKGVYEYFSKK